MSVTDLTIQRTEIEARIATFEQRQKEAEKAQQQLLVLQRMGGNVEAYTTFIKAKQQELVKGATETNLMIEQYNKEQQEFSDYLSKVSKGRESVENINIKTGWRGNVGYYFTTETKYGFKASGETQEVKTQEDLEQWAITDTKQGLGLGSDDIITINGRVAQESSFAPEQISVANQVFSTRMSALASYEKAKAEQQERLKAGWSGQFKDDAMFKEIQSKGYAFGSVDIIKTQELFDATKGLSPLAAASFLKAGLKGTFGKETLENVRYTVGDVTFSDPKMADKYSNQIKTNVIEGVSPELSQPDQKKYQTRLEGWGVLTPFAYAEKHGFALPEQTLTEMQQAKDVYATDWWAGLPLSEKIQYGGEAFTKNIYSRPIDVIFAGGDFSKIKPFETMAYETYKGKQASYIQSGQSYWGGFAENLIANEAIYTVGSVVAFGGGLGLVSRVAPRFATAVGLGAVGLGIGDIGYKAYKGETRSAAIESLAFITSAPLAVASFKAVGGRTVPISELVPKFQVPEMLRGKYEVRGGLMVDTAGTRRFTSDVGQILGKSGYEEPISPTEYFGSITRSRFLAEGDIQGSNKIFGGMAKKNIKTMDEFFKDEAKLLESQKIKEGVIEVKVKSEGIKQPPRRRIVSLTDIVNKNIAEGTIEGKPDIKESFQSMLRKSGKQPFIGMPTSKGLFSGAPTESIFSKTGGMYKKPEQMPGRFSVVLSKYGRKKPMIEVKEITKKGQKYGRKRIVTLEDIIKKREATKPKEPFIKTEKEIRTSTGQVLILKQELKPLKQKTEVKAKPKSPDIVIPPSNLLLKQELKPLKQKTEVKAKNVQKTMSELKLAVHQKERVDVQQRYLTMTTPITTTKTTTNQIYRETQKYQPVQVSKISPIVAVFEISRLRVSQKPSSTLRTIQKPASRLKLFKSNIAKRTIHGGRGFYAYKEHAKIATSSQILRGMMDR